MPGISFMDFMECAYANDLEVDSCFNTYKRVRDDEDDNEQNKPKKNNDSDWEPKGW